MSTHAVGIDMIEIDRVRRVLERHPERFIGRVYTPEEAAFCRGRVPELAARFAAKEAVMKALGTGARMRNRAGSGWKEIEVLPDPLGKPIVHLHGQARERAREMGMVNLDISMTHSREYAAASVVGGRD